MLRFLFTFGIIGLLIGCKTSEAPFKNRWTKQKAPAVFKARFETTKGIFEIEANRQWSPKGVDRFYQLIKNGYYSNIPVYRVVPNFVAQFGSLDTALNLPWEKIKLEDEPVVESNELGTIAFARGGKHTRGTQIFINIKNNTQRLDTLGTAIGVPGFPVIAKITTGLDVATAFFSYNDAPRRNMRNEKDIYAYLLKDYPKMDYIKKAFILKNYQK